MRKYGYRMNKMLNPERKIVFGTLAFNSFKERIRLMSELQKEFNNKVKITVEENILMYEYISIEE
jgi:hypothetical protein